MLTFWDAVALISLSAVCSVMWHLGAYLSELLIKGFETWAVLKLKEQQR